MSAQTIGPHYRDGTIRVERETDRVSVICVEGDFDRANASVLDTEIETALDAGRQVIVDFTDATFIDSSVINILARWSKAVCKRDHHVVIQASTTATVERILTLVQIERMLPRAHSRAEALHLLRSTAS